MYKQTLPDWNITQPINSSRGEEHYELTSTADIHLYILRILLSMDALTSYGRAHPWKRLLLREER